MRNLLVIINFMKTGAARKRRADEIQKDEEPVHTKEQIITRRVVKAKRIIPSELKNGNQEEEKGKFSLSKRHFSSKLTRQILVGNASNIEKPKSKGMREIPHLNKICKNPFCKIKVEEHSDSSKCLAVKNPTPQQSKCKGTECTNPFCECKSSKPLSCSLEEQKYEAISRNPFLSKVKPVGSSNNSTDDKDTAASDADKPKFKNPFLAKAASAKKNDELADAKEDSKSNEHKPNPFAAKGNPFDRIKEHAVTTIKDVNPSSKKKTWFPNPFAPPTVKTEEEKLGKL